MRKGGVRGQEIVREKEIVPSSSKKSIFSDRASLSHHWDLSY
jgi:hypothetical protein